MNLHMTTLGPLRLTLEWLKFILDFRYLLSVSQKPNLLPIHVR